DRHVVALRRPDAAEDAVGRRLDLDRHLVGLDLHQRLALRHLLAVRAEPAQELSRLLRHSERRHYHLGGYDFAPSRVGVVARWPPAVERDSASRIQGSAPPTVDWPAAAADRL